MAAEAILSVVFQQLLSITAEEARKQISLVGDVKKEVNKFTTNFQAIKAVLVDAEQRQVKEETVKLWLDQLRDISYDMEDVLDEWNTEMMKFQIEGAHENVDHLVSKKKVCCFLPSPCFGIKQAVLRRDIALKIKEINENLDDVAKRKDMFNFNVSTEKPKGEETTSLVDESEIFGRDDEKKTLVNMLLSGSSNSQEGPRVISLVGMGGIGKTTLAQLAYKDDEITRTFQKKMWVCVSDPFDVFKITKNILESFKRDTSNLTSLESLSNEVRKSIEGMKFFLVLDDVWTEDYNEWERLYICLKYGLPGSKILVTTRSQIVAQTMNSYDILDINKLSDDQCWSLFKKLAFFNRAPDECEKMEVIGREIVKKCKGLPLAAKTMGSLLRHKKSIEEWQLILDDEMWKLESFEKGIFPPILLSYNDLSPMVKSCFLYCAIFPKDWRMSSDELIYLWMAQGYLSSNQNKEMEIIGKEYFDILADRSFFQEFQNDDYNVTCKMHDIVHDVALLLSRNECLTIEDNDFENWSTNSSLDKTRHLMVSKPVGKKSPSFVFELKKLRSLLIKDDQFPVNIEKLTHLRALKFGCWLVKKFPMEITKLIYLKFLHLIVGEDIEALPDTLCKLYNLQTLRVEGRNLKRLPQKMEKLIKLRHLILDNSPFWRPSLSYYMPKGIERLTCLRTLTTFVINGNSDNNDEACGLEALKNLNHLRGELHIRRLGNVKDVREIKGAEFWNKKNLIKLGLNFEVTMPGHADHEILLEAFDPPPPNLQDLGITRYRGNIIVSSNWMMSLTGLKILCLDFCENLECLPPLGKCPYLESLEMGHMTRIKRASNEFLGVEIGVASSSSSSSPSNIIIFPKLKFLRFFAMENWEEWDYGITRKDEEHITIMPHLQSLTFNHCPNLRVLPEELFQRITLEEFDISPTHSQILKERYEEWSKRKQRECPYPVN